MRDFRVCVTPSFDRVPMMLLTDTTFVEELGDVIHRNPHLIGRRLHVATDSERIVIEGKVTSYYQKQMAQEAIRRIDGVRWIENRIEVTPS